MTTMAAGRYDSILAAIGDTPLVELSNLSPRPGVRLFAKLEAVNPTGSTKDRVALAMVEAAERRGDIRPGCSLVEPTTGNTGVALAMIGRRKGYQVTIVIPENVSQETQQLLATFGAEVVLTPAEKGSRGAIEYAEQMVALRAGCHMPFQFANPANTESHYRTTGAEICAALPRVDAFVAGLGTGGTLMGVGARLKERDPHTRVIAVEPYAGEWVHGLRSLEDGFIPPLLDLSRLDGKLLVHATDAFAACRRLAEAEGIFAGVSSGAILHATLRIVQRMRRGTVVMLFPDGGHKYLSTGIWTTQPQHLPEEVSRMILW